MKRWPRLARVGIAAVALPCLGVLGLWVASLTVPFPTSLEAPPPSSVRILDRSGHLLARVRRDGQLSEHITVDQLSPHVVPALLAAEDQRFFAHPGVDPVAIGRAVLQAAWHGRLVSGASTLTQQLARSTFERPRSLLGKLHEMAVALCIERHLSKNEILEAYLNRIAFGPRVRGIQAAARLYFDKPASYLSLSEAATLVALPRGPTLYDPRRQGSPIARRRHRVLERMADTGTISRADAHRTQRLPLRLQSGSTWPGAHHWVRRLQGLGPSDELHSTLDSALQRRVEELVVEHGRRMKRFGASAASVLVVDNPSREVLAYVGSVDYSDAKSEGQNDGVTALRQPGSTLKPFVYAAAMEQLGFTAATLLPDLELELGTPQKPFSPRNYDRRFHGPVRLREALASSLNVPAAYTAARLGIGNALTALHRFGFESLRQAPDHYGAALALGDGEVTLEELTAAYATLANGGLYAPLRIVKDRPPRRKSAERRATSAEIAAILWDILSDPRARAAGFGRDGVLEFPYQVAVKTGTSKGARDNWTVGSTPRLTVAVWVGNFDGKPMLGASGVTGAAPLFHAVLDEAVRLSGGPEAPRNPEASGLDLRRVEICATSGLLPTELCPERIPEWFRRGTEPEHDDTMHARFADEVVEVYPEPYRAWARDAGRPLGRGATDVP